MFQAPPSTPPKVPQIAYISLTGGIDQAFVQRVFQTVAICVNTGVKSVHLLLQSQGGNVSEGVALYNYFRALPLDLHFYNGGTVSSIAVIAFLGAKNRYASANATFMIHKTHSPNQMPATKAASLRALANSYDIEDARTLSILKTNLTLSPRRLNHHRTHELPFDANAALAAGLITKITDFVVPSGSQLSNI